MFTTEPRRRWYVNLPNVAGTPWMMPPIYGKSDTGIQSCEPSSNYLCQLKVLGCIPHHGREKGTSRVRFKPVPGQPMCLNSGWWTGWFRLTGPDLGCLLPFRGWIRYYCSLL